MFDEPSLVKNSNGEYEASFHDRAVTATFYNEKVLMEHESKVSGEEVYREDPHIRIEFPGDRNKVVVRPILPDDSKRFPREFALFQTGDTRLQGTLISDWDGVSPDDTRSLNGFGVLTIEQLSAIPDARLEGLGLGARLFRERARKWVEAHGTRHDSRADTLAAENAELKARMERMEAFMERAAAEQGKLPARKAA